MPKGGKRPGAGRKKGSTNKRTREIAEKALKNGMTPLEYMLRVLRNPNTPQDRRDHMAIAAAPYLHPRLQAVEHSGVGDGLVSIKVVQFTAPPLLEQGALPGEVRQLAQKK